MVWPGRETVDGRPVPADCAVVSGERRGRRMPAALMPVNQMPWSQPRMMLEPSRILSDDQIEAIHNKSLLVLEEIGMDILLPQAREILARHVQDCVETALAKGELKWLEPPARPQARTRRPHQEAARPMGPRPRRVSARGSKRKARMA